MVNIIKSTYCYENILYKVRSNGNVDIIYTFCLKTILMSSFRWGNRGHRYKKSTESARNNC